MTAPISSIPAVRAYLVDALNSAISTAGFVEPGVEAFDGAPDDMSPNDQIIVGDTRRETSAGALVGGGGQHWRFEKFHVHVNIEAFASGVAASMSQADTRGHALLALVETVVRKDPSLGGLAVVAHPSSSESTYSWDKDHKGAFCHITMSIFVHAEQ